MKKTFAFLLLLAAGTAHAQQYRTIHNPFTGTQDYVINVASTSIGAFVDVSTAGAVNGNCFTFNGTKWVAGSCGGGGGGTPSVYVASITTNASLNINTLGAQGSTVTLSVNVSSISLPNSGVTAGSYTSTNLTVDSHGLISSASNGSSGVSVYPATSTIIATTAGISVSTIVVNSGTALAITSGASRARFRMAGILSIQNTNSDNPDSTGIFLAAASTSTGAPAFYTVRRASGTVASPAATGAGMNLLQLSAGGYGATNWAAASTGRLNFIAEEQFTDTSQATGMQINTTPTGSITSAERVYVGGNGAVTIFSSATLKSAVLFSSSTAGLFDTTFGAAQAKLPASNSPYISNSTSELTASVYFDDTSTQSATWSVLMTKYDGRPLSVDILFTSTATSGTINWFVYTATNTPNSSTNNFDLTTFNVAVSTVVTVTGNSNALQKATVALSNTVVSNGDILTVKLEREAGLSDTAVGFGRDKYLRTYE